MILSQFALSGYMLSDIKGSIWGHDLFLNFPTNCCLSLAIFRLLYSSDLMTFLSLSFTDLLGEPCLTADLYQRWQTERNCLGCRSAAMTIWARWKTIRSVQLQNSDVRLTPLPGRSVRVDAVGDSFGRLLRNLGVTLKWPFTPLWFSLPPNDDQADQRGCSKENWRRWLPPSPVPPSSTPLICTLNIWTPPSIHATRSLSRCIYIFCCRAKVVSRFICAEFIGSSLLSCFGLCVVSEMQRVKCKPWGHAQVTGGGKKTARVRHITFVANTKCDHCWACWCLSVNMRWCTYAHRSVDVRWVCVVCAGAFPSVLTQAAVIVLELQITRAAIRGLI